MVFRPLLAVLSLSALIACTSCRTLTVSRPTSEVGEFYHTELANDGKPHSSLVQQMIAERKDALAAPAAVIDSDDSTSTWSILCATNRVPVKTKGGATTYGKDVDSVMQYSRCRVAVPHVHTLDPIRGSKLSPFASNPTKQVKLEPPQPVSRQRFYTDLTNIVERSTERDVFVFVHGFNVDYDHAVTRAAQMAEDMPFNGAVVCYSWPSQASRFKYKTDQIIADASAAVLAQFLTDLGDSLPNDVTINLVAHSMGNRVLMQAMNRLPGRFAYPQRFNEVVLAAPDVGVTRFKALLPSHQSCQPSCDAVRQRRRRPLMLSWFVNREQRAGDSAQPLRVEHLETVDVSRVDVGFMGHSYYGSNRSVLRDLFSVIKQHKPIDKRYWLRPRKRTAGTYWEFDTEVSPIVRVANGVVQ